MSVYSYSQFKVEKQKFKEEVNKRRAPSPKRTPYQQFVENTTLLGIQHVLRNKSFVWLVAYLLCVAMSIAQSWNVTVTFFERKTYQTSTIASHNLMPFPSVTFCSNTVFRKGFNFSTIPNFNTSVPEKLKNCSQSHIKQEWLDVKNENKKIAMRYLRILTSEKRAKLGIDTVKEFVKKCTFNMQPCNFADKNEIYIFNHPYFANCFTFNPAFDKKHAKYTDIQTGLELLVQFPSDGYWLTDESVPNGILHVHAPGTAPFIESPHSTDFVGGDLLHIEMDLAEMTVLKKQNKNMPSCVDNEDEAYRMRSRYYSADSPYRYSLEACMASCYQDYAGEDCNVISPYLPMQSAEYEKDKTTEHCRIKRSTDMEACNCPISCKQLDYKVAAHTDEIEKIPCGEEDEESDMHEVSHKHAHGHHHHHHHQKHGHHENWEEAEIGVKFRRNIYEKFEERLCYSLSEYLGVLGGNLSLWIGLCVISLLEVVELGIQTVMNAVRPSRHISSSSPTRKFHGIKRQNDLFRRPLSTYHHPKNATRKMKSLAVHVYPNERQANKKRSPLFNPFYSEFSR